MCEKAPGNGPVMLRRSPLSGRTQNFGRDSHDNSGEARTRTRPTCFEGFRNQQLRVLWAGGARRERGIEGSAAIRLTRVSPGQRGGSRFRWNAVTGRLANTHHRTRLNPVAVNEPGGRFYDGECHQ